MCAVGCTAALVGIEWLTSLIIEVGGGTWWVVRVTGCMAWSGIRLANVLLAMVRLRMTGLATKWLEAFRGDGIEKAIMRWSTVKLRYGENLNIVIPLPHLCEDGVFCVIVSQWI